MVSEGEVRPFFHIFFDELSIVNDRPDEAAQNLISSDPLFYNMSMFRAFLHLTSDDIENMSIDDYLKYSAILKDVLRIIHAPFLNHDNDG